VSHKESSHESYEIVGPLVLNDVPFEAIPAMIEKNVSLRGFSLGASLHQGPRVLAAFFKLVGEGKLKFEITKYPLAEAAKVHERFEARKTSGKIVVFRRSEKRNRALQHINLDAS
jgi:D-arabinose 1-dehydrogenase-like Zn-dependent alcohol dehydrogenase